MQTPTSRARSAFLRAAITRILWPHGDSCAMCRARLFPGHGFKTDPGTLTWAPGRWIS